MGVILGRFVGVCSIQIWVGFGARFRSIRWDDSGFVSVGVGSYGLTEWWLGGVALGLFYVVLRCFTLFYITLFCGFLCLMFI